MQLQSNQDPHVSVVILNYNGRCFLEDCLESVLDSTYPNFEVIFVDNGSNDGSVELVRQRFTTDLRLKMIVNSENFGFSEGNNIGVGESKGEIVVFLSNDTKVDPRWIKELVKLLKEDNKIGAVQCKILSYDNLNKIDSAGGIMDRFGLTAERGRIYDECESDVGQYDKVDEIFFANAAAMAVRKNVLDKVGVFDSKFFAGYEDVDLSWRIRLAGYRIIFAPKSKVFHRRGVTVIKKGMRSLHYQKDRMAMYIKNCGFERLVELMPFALSIYFLTFIVGLFTVNMEFAVTPIKAIMWNIREFKYLMQQRAIVQTRIRQVSDQEILRLMQKRSVLMQRRIPVLQ